MPSPLIPVEALLELRRLLDSMQAAETKCERTPLVPATSVGQPEPRQCQQLEPADNPRKQKNRQTSFRSFNNILR